MRPKPIILCYDDNEQELSAMKFTLETKHYKVLTASTPGEAIAIFSTAYDLRIELIADYSRRARGWMSGKELLVKLKEMNSHIPMVLLGEPHAGENRIGIADALVPKTDCSMVALLEYIHSLGAKKRGPRKGWRAALAATTA